RSRDSRALSRSETGRISSAAASGIRVVALVARHGYWHRSSLHAGGDGIQVEERRIHRSALYLRQLLFVSRSRIDPVFKTIWNWTRHRHQAAALCAALDRSDFSRHPQYRGRNDPSQDLTAIRSLCNQPRAKNDRTPKITFFT